MQKVVFDPETSNGRLAEGDDKRQAGINEQSNGQAECGYIDEPGLNPITGEDTAMRPMAQPLDTL